MMYNIIKQNVVKSRGGKEFMEQFTLRLKRDDLEKIKAIAKEQDRSANYVIGEIISKFLKGAN